MERGTIRPGNIRKIHQRGNEWSILPQMQIYWSHEGAGWTDSARIRRAHQQIKGAERLSEDSSVNMGPGQGLMEIGTTGLSL
jgi:hypothetical protein